MPAGEEHSACLVELTDGKTIMADLTQEGISEPFVFRDQYGAAGNYWELKQKENPLKIPRRIQILDRNGILADIYNCLGNAYAKSGKESEAVSYFHKAIELCPKLAKAYSSRGVELFKHGSTHESRYPTWTKPFSSIPKTPRHISTRGRYTPDRDKKRKPFPTLPKPSNLSRYFRRHIKAGETYTLRSGQNSRSLVRLRQGH